MVNRQKSCPLPEFGGREAGDTQQTCKKANCVVEGDMLYERKRNLGWRECSFQ